MSSLIMFSFSEESYVDTNGQKTPKFGILESWKDSTAQVGSRVIPSQTHYPGPWALGTGPAADAVESLVSPGAHGVEEARGSAPAPRHGPSKPGFFASAATQSASWTPPFPFISLHYLQAVCPACPRHCALPAQYYLTIQTVATRYTK